MRIIFFVHVGDTRFTVFKSLISYQCNRLDYQFNIFKRFY